ncbi:MAG TPA: F0F1 ATP synthase subunit gamma [Alphaproteobacteria bacterium]|nr:F0F1 ATP synthase subunit gamma [Alphaproteobacteria bacterium]
MPSLKDLKNRIGSVKSTRKITSAMKMVAASKLRRAQENAESARPYAQRMARMLESLCSNLVITDTTPRLIAGTGSDKTVLLIVVTSDRGLCGGFNGTIVREARKQIRQLEAAGKTVKLLCVGRKGRDLLRREHGKKIVESFTDVGRKKLSFSEANEITTRITHMFEAGEFDVAQIVYNRFKSAIAQVVTVAQLVPVAIEEKAANENQTEQHEPTAVYEFEPDEETILAELLPRNLAMQVYGALLESAAGEQGARMAAMDNATRNAGDMINKLTLNYNRARQANITKELIEIISGAEAV